MKPQTLYEIHALIGRCYLHTKNKSTYAITLKMGSKIVANTEFKLPLNDEINYNTELILKIDKTLYEGAGKLSLIVTMLSEGKQRKIIGSVFANFKQKGVQTYKVSQCSCKDKGFQVNVEFEVVCIQNLINNQNNNKFQSPNHSEMKDLKKALTVSRQKQLIKSSRAKQSIASKSPVQKTSAKVSRLNYQKQLKYQMSPDLSSLTTKMVPSSAKRNEQTKQYVQELKDKILGLQNKVKEYSSKDKAHRNQICSLHSQIEILKNENSCLLQILEFQEEKSSAAISYIQYLTQKVSQKLLVNSNLNPFLQLCSNLKVQAKTDDAAQAIKSHNQQIRTLKDTSFQFRPIQQTINQKEEIQEQNTERLVRQLQNYKISIEELRQKIADFESQEVQKGQNIMFLQSEISKINSQNLSLKQENGQLHKSIASKEKQLKQLSTLNRTLDYKIKQLTQELSSLKQVKKKTLQENKKSLQENKKLQKNANKNVQENNQLNKRISQLQTQILRLKGLQIQYDDLLKENQKLKAEPPQTPLQSEIVPHKSRYEEGGDTRQIQNILEQIDGGTDAKNLLISSRRFNNENQHFLSRNKSESLLKDLQGEPNSDDPNTNQISGDLYKANYKQGESKHLKKIQIVEPEKNIQKYNYEYDIDSLNYFNNFEQDHERMSESGVQDNTCEIQIEH